MAGGTKNVKAEQAAQEAEPLKPEDKWIPGQLLVSFKDEAAAQSRAEIWKKHGAREVEKVGVSPLYLIQFPKGVDIKAKQAELAKAPGVKYVEPNMVMKTFQSK